MMKREKFNKFLVTQIILRKFRDQKLKAFYYYCSIYIMYTLVKTRNQKYLDKSPFAF